MKTLQLLPSNISTCVYAAAIGMLAAGFFPALHGGQSVAPQPDATPSLRLPETPGQHDARMAWWRQAKFGMFVHWGIYAIPAEKEDAWYMRIHHVALADYAKLAEQFNPTKFNADEWAALAHDAGMRYMVFTTKHHDGFAMFHSKASAYNVYDATPFKRDPLKDLSGACPRHGIRLGTYYSAAADWGHPGGGVNCPKWDKAQEGDFSQYVSAVAAPQVAELLSNYGPIAVMWFDTDGSRFLSLDDVKPIAEALKLQPSVIVDPRINGLPGDFATEERSIPSLPPNKDWEYCTTTNWNWGYNPRPACPLPELMRQLVEAWGKGGNVLLNVGPDATGVIPADSAERLREIGAWLRVNGDAIYGSTAGPFDYVPWGSATRKKDKLYLLVSHWPTDGLLRVPLAVKAGNPTIIGSPGIKLAMDTQGDHMIIHVPETGPDPVANVISLDVTGDIPSVHSLIFDKPATASTNGKTAHFAVDDRTATRWTCPGPAGWLEIDMGKPQTFNTLRAQFPLSKVRHISLQVKDADKWKTVIDQDKLPKGTYMVKFPPVTAQVVRLNVAGDGGEMRVADFGIFPLQ